MNESGTLLRLPAVCRQVGLGKTTLYKLVREQRFPAPVRINGLRAIAWRSGDVSAWIERQGQQQAAEAAA